MHLTIIGTGFVGVVSSAVFSSFGHTVYGLDIDQTKIDKLNHAQIPFYEPGLEELVKGALAKGNLKFTTSYEESIPGADLVIIAVGTPSAPDGQADLKFVFAAAESMAPHLKSGAIIAIKSTVPPGTCDKVREVIRKKQSNPVLFSVVSLPEFLREGSAVEDTLHPDRVIIGAKEPEVIEVLKELHKPLEAPFVVMNPESAQMCKYSANAYLATRITFINQIANLCEANGANIQDVIAGIGYDRRIGKHYWYPGLGYGGSCFPKDVKELAAYAKANNQESNLMVTLNALNESRIPELMEKFGKTFGGWEGKKVAVLGLSFKPNTDDMREAPSCKVVPWLLEHKAMPVGYDPMAAEAAERFFNGSLTIAKTPDEAMTGAAVVILLVEWPQLTTIDPKQIATLAPGATLIDTRNQFSEAAVVGAGLKYIGIGQ